MLKKPHRTHPSSARFVGQPTYQNDGYKKTPPQTWQDFTRNFDFYPNQEKLQLTKRLLKKGFAKQTQTQILENPTQPKDNNANETEIIL
jgi:hypothetical protein